MGLSLIAISKLFTSILDTAKLLVHKGNTDKYYLQLAATLQSISFYDLPTLAYVNIDPGQLVLLAFPHTLLGILRHAQKKNGRRRLIPL